MAAAALRRQGFALRLARLEHQRWASQPALREDLKQGKVAAPAPASKPEVVYEGAMAGTLRRVKILSFTSFVFSSLGAPVLAFHTYPEVSVVAKSSIASMMMMLSALTTAGLHWYAGPYVRKLSWKPGSKEVAIETLDVLARRVERKIQLSDVHPPDTNKPLVTFFARGNHYYIEEDRFPSPELLKKLVPRR
ncbi:transmembrane protein 70, mitochondrial [Selaginella moellendorffii]|nr:transmembrane protein 70, mitochondrial [Selaginella moellendorffii]|eukprot:XP_002981974.2 transmembrane protein 70, mitochondrial [Selaginella moellendorffii]